MLTKINCCTMHAAPDAAVGRCCRTILGDTATDELLGQLLRQHQKDDYDKYLQKSDYTQEPADLPSEATKEPKAKQAVTSESLETSGGGSLPPTSADSNAEEADASNHSEAVLSQSDTPATVEATAVDELIPGAEEAAKDAAEEAESIARKEKLEAIVLGRKEVRDEASRERWKQVEDDDDSGDEALGILSSLGRSMSTWASVAFIGFSFTMSSDPTVAGRQIANLCRSKGGIYVKAAQSASSMDYAFPKEILEEFQSLQDSADAQPWSEIAERVEKHTPGGINMMYDSFSEDPVNAASIAQVHVAHRKTGDKVAVKNL